MRRKRIYVAGPTSKGDVLLNVCEAVLAADRLLSVGHYPYVPHLHCLWNMLAPRPYEDWLALDFEWLACCEALVRLPGESAGADREVLFARSRGIPVYFGLGACVEGLAGG